MSWQERLTTEHSEVKARLDKLTAFIYEDSGGVVNRTRQFRDLPSDDQDDLLEQLMHMEGYEDVLARRAARLGL